MKRLGVFIAMCGVLACSDDTRATPPADAAAGDVTVEPTDAGDGGARDAASDALVEPSGPPLGPRDRAGRPLVTKLLVAPSNQDLVGQVEEPFTIDTLARASGNPVSVGIEMVRRLTTLDALDGKTDFPATATDHPLIDLLVDDGLVVDPSMPFSPSGFLDVEVNGAAHATCGGRYPGDDAVDKMLSFLVSKKLTGVSDGVDAPSSPPTLSFPYLAPPH